MLVCTAYARTLDPATPAHAPPAIVGGMKRYANLSGESGVVAYESRATSIVVQFQDGWKYEYTRHSAGADVVARMKALAAAGRGLSTFIAQDVKDAYGRKFR